MTRRRAVIAFCALALLALALVPLIAQTGDSESSGTSASETGIAAGAQDEPELTELLPASGGRKAGVVTYGILKKPPLPADARPDDLDGLAASVGTHVEADARLARAGLSVAGKPTFVIPGRIGLCMVIEQYGSCTRTRPAADGYAVFWYCVADRPGYSRVIGVVPDGIRKVNVKRTSGSVDLTVRESMYASDARGIPVTVTVGTTTIDMPSSGDPKECDRPQAQPPE